MRKALLTTAWALFVAGGLAGGAIGIRNLTVLPRTPASISSGAPAPVPTQELAAHPNLRDFDQNPPPAESTGRMNILLMGIDQRPDETGANGDPGRTDSLMLVSLDFDDHLATLVSIPRDGFV